MEGTPPGDTLPPPQQRATPACKGARSGAGAGSPRPHRPRLGHTGRGTLTARSRGRAAGGGTAPATRRPSQRWQASPPQGRPPTNLAACTPHRACRPKGQCWAPTPTHPRPQHVGGGPQRPAQRAGSLGRDSAWTQAPLTMVEGTPPGDTLPPPPQRATPARKGARCGAGAGSPRPHGPRLGHTGRGTLTARSRGRAAGGGTAPDTRRPSQRWQATPPGDDPPPPPRHTAHRGHAGQGNSVGPPHPHTRAHSTWVADPNGPPSGRAVGGGTAPDPRRPSQRWKAPFPGTPFHHPHNEQRQPARAHAVGPVLGPHARTDRTRDTRVAEPWPPAPEDGRPGEGQRLTARAPHNAGRPPPLGTAPHHPRSTQPPQGMQAKGTVLGPHTHTPAPTARGWQTPTARPVGGQSGEGQRLTSDAPHNGGRHPPGDLFRHPHSEQRRPTGAHTVGPVLGPHARTDRTRDTRVAEPWLPAPEDGRPGEGQRLTPDALHNGGRPPPPGTAPHHPRGTQPPQGMQARGTVLCPHTHTPAPTARGWRTPTARPAGGQSGEGERLTSDAPHNGRRHHPRGRPSATPTASNAGLQRRTLWDRCWVPTPAPGHRVAEPWLPAPEDGRPGEGQRLTPGAPHNGGRPPSGHGAPPPPRHAAPTGHAGQGDSVGPPHPHTRAHSTWVADPNGPPSGRAVGGGTAPDLRRPSQWWKAPPPGTPFRQPHSEQRRPTGAHTLGPVLGPHACTDRTRETRVAEPWLPAPEDGRPGEGQPLTPDAPHNGGRPPPPGMAPQHPRGTQPPQGMQARGTVLGPHTHTPAPTARGWRTPTARPIGGQSGEGQRLTSDAPHTMVEGTPPGAALPPPPQRATPARKGARCEAGAGSPCPHRPHPGHTGRGTPATRSRGRAAGGGTAPNTRRPLQ